MLLQHFPWCERCIIPQEPAEAAEGAENGTAANGAEEPLRCLKHQHRFICFTLLCSPGCKHSAISM